MEFVIIYLIWGIIWGIVTLKVNENKGYQGGFWWGFFLGIIGLLVVVCKPDNVRYNYSNGNSSSSNYVEPIVKNNDTWKCARCGRFNSSFSCSCGLLKGDSYRLEKRQIEENLARASEDKEIINEKAQKENELKNIQLLKSYKELLDEGVITQDDFDKKKAELLENI
ncbi:MAG: SHOCT domain-containing protein [Lachnospiraceae bacterium]|nr:SHOCT domain-containing protein [Lachnospiraceae bacterium]